MAAYTRFKYDGELYEFRRMPFGLSVASHVFTWYLTIQILLAKGRFLTSLLPYCKVRGDDELATTNPTREARGDERWTQ